MTPIAVKFSAEDNAAYIRFSQGEVLESEEVAPGIILDFDADGRIVGMEVLNADKNLSPEILTQAA